MKGKERFINALKRNKPIDKIPTFELVYYLTMELMGKVHPTHRNYAQWDQMTARERNLHIQDMARVYVDTAKHYGHDAIFCHHNPYTLEVLKNLLTEIREISGDEYFLCVHGDCTLPIPEGDTMVEFAAMMYDEPEKFIKQQEDAYSASINMAEQLSGTGLLDGFALCSDYAFNANPFYSPDMFADLVAPMLKKEIDSYRALGYYTIKHTDGNINPILDQIVACGPDAIHSIDPQGHMCLKEVREKYGDKIATIGNVNCGLLQTGTDEQVVQEVNRVLEEGRTNQARGFIFSTSNCVYTGMNIERYDLMMNIFEKQRTIF